jgi:hypothetical protein
MISENLRRLREQSSGTIKELLRCAEILLLTRDWGRNTLSDLFIEDNSKTSETISQMSMEMGEMASKSLFAEVCMGIPHYGKRKRRHVKLSQERDIVRKETWESLSKHDLSSSYKLAKKLKRLGYRAAHLHGRNISALQKARAETDNDKDKESLAKQELEETKMMKRSGLDYSTGLYLSKILSFAKRKYLDPANEEFKAASKLPYMSKQKWITANTSQLLNNPDKYDGKNIQVEGIVSSLREKKSQTGPVERVFSIIKILSEEVEAEAYYAQYWLSDNGLSKGSYTNICGKFNKSCPDVNRPDIHLTRVGLEEGAKKDWIGRCKWLVRDWWDGFTDRTQADWTLGTLNPNPNSFGASVSEEKEYSENLIQSVRESYPSTRAALRTLKDVVRGPLNRNSQSIYRGTLGFRYLHGFMIDLFLLLTVLSSSRIPKTLKLSRIIEDTTPFPWVQTNLVEQQLMFGIEKRPVEIDFGLGWLEYSLENYEIIGGA